MPLLVGAGLQDLAGLDGCPVNWEWVVVTQVIGSFGLVYSRIGLQFFTGSIFFISVGT